MKILQINSTVNFGGGERHLIDLTKGLINRKHDVFVAIRPNCEWKKRLETIAKYELPLRNSLDVASAIKLAKFIKANKIEIVHAHTARDYMVASLAVRMAKTAKLILTRHVLFPIKSAFLLKNVSKIIAVSSAVETTLSKSFPTKKIAVIPNGIDLANWSNVDNERFRKEFRFEHEISYDDFVIGIVGELKQLKGQEDFVLAAQIVAKKFPNAFFVIVGKDNSITKEFRLTLKRLVKIFNLESRFLWLNWVEDTSYLLSALDLFVSASHTESFGLAIVEAMANKTCIVATKTEGAKEILEDEKTALLSEIKNPIELAEKICELIRNKEKRDFLANNAQTVAKEKFGLQKMIDETEKLYQDLVAKKSF